MSLDFPGIKKSLGTKIGVVKYKKQKQKNNEPQDSRTRGPAAPAVLVPIISLSTKSFKIFIWQEQIVGFSPPTKTQQNYP